MTGQKVLSIREGLRALSQTMVVLSTGIFILQVYGAIIPTYLQYRSLEQYRGTRVLLTSHGKILKRSLMMMVYLFTAYGNLLLHMTTGILQMVTLPTKVFYLTLAMMMVYITLKMKGHLSKKSAVTNNITLTMKIER